MYIVYILQSINYKRHYIGHTNNLTDRISRHNNGKVFSTKPYRPWIIIYKETKSTKSDAIKREMEIKRYKGGIQFREILKKYGEIAYPA